MHLTEGQLISSRYRIVSKIGTGGMSVVYRAVDIKLDRDVTFKALNNISEAEEINSKVLGEARAVARLNHPNIVDIYDVGEDGGVNYIIMEFVDGTTLKDLIRGRAPLDNEEIISVALQMAAALSHAHHNKIIHRDIKPQNVLITSAGTVKVADFGIARALHKNGDTKELSKEITLGSVHYLSPEQAQGTITDARSDLYSLGIVMFEMATGSLPFDSEQVVSVALKHVNEPLPDIHALNPDISPAIESIIRKLTQKRPERRYQDADSLANDLRAAAKDPDTVLFEEPKEEASPTIKVSKEQIQSIRNNIGKGKRPDYTDETNSYSDNEIGEYAEKSDWRMIFGAVATALLIIAVILWLAYPKIKPILDTISGKSVVTSDSIKMPNVVGTDFNYAAAECERLGFSLRKVDRTSAESDIKLNEITQQSKASGEPVLHGEVIEVGVYVGTDSYTMPDLRGKTFLDAQAAIQSLPVTLSMIEEYNDEYEKGIIFRQKPEPDSPIAAGDEVTVYIGAGTQVEKITVPNLVGKTYEQAEELLSGVGIPIGSSTYAASNDYAEGLIIAQSIEADKEIAAVGSKIGVVISSGPRPTRTPATSPPKATATPVPEPTSTPAATEIPTSEPNEPTQSPTDNPSLPPTTIPTVLPTEPPTAPPTTQRTKVLTVDFGFAGDYAADLPLHVEVYRLDSSGETLVYDANPIFAEFPIQVPLTDSGMREFVVKIAGVETSSAMIDFDN